MDCNCNIQTYQRSVSMTAYVRTGASAFGAPLTATICIPLTDGYLISVAVSMTATFVIEAAMWAVAEIRSNSCSGTSSATLFQDYLQFGKTLGWPGGRQLSVGEGPGTARWRNFTYTAGGGGFTDTWQVPGGSLGLCRQIYFGLTTNAAAGNRVVYVAYTPPEGGLMFFGGALSQPLPVFAGCLPPTSRRDCSTASSPSRLSLITSGLPAEAASTCLSITTTRETLWTAAAWPSRCGRARS